MEIPISSFGALESKPLGESTKSSTLDAQKSTNLKSELWFFHSELGIFRAHNQPKVFYFFSLLAMGDIVVVVVVHKGAFGAPDYKYYKY
jgi:hypothetical protein